MLLLLSVLGLSCVVLYTSESISPICVFDDVRVLHAPVMGQLAFDNSTEMVIRTFSNWNCEIFYLLADVIELICETKQNKLNDYCKLIDSTSIVLPRPPIRNIRVMCHYEILNERRIGFHFCRCAVFAILAYTKSGRQAVLNCGKTRVAFHPLLQCFWRLCKRIAHRSCALHTQLPCGIVCSYPSYYNQLYMYMRAWIGVHVHVFVWWLMFFSPL